VYAGEEGDFIKDVIASVYSGISFAILEVSVWKW